MQIYDDADLREKLGEEAALQAELLVTPVEDVSRRASIQWGLDTLSSAIGEYRDAVAELRSLTGDEPAEHLPDPDQYQ